MTSPLLPAYSVDMDKHDLAHLWSVKGRAPFVPMMRAKSRSSRRRFRVSLAVLMVMLFYALRIANEVCIFASPPIISLSAVSLHQLLHNAENNTRSR